MSIQSTPRRNLPRASAGKLADADYKALADFRFQIRRFLHFSEAEAHAEGLEPQQHQFLLAIRALTGSHGPTVGELAEHLLIRHHSAVGLVDRMVEHGMVERLRGEGDRRQVRVRLTVQGETTLKRLTNIHRAELLNSGPLLVKSLAGLLRQLRRESTPPRQKKDGTSETKRPIRIK